MKKRTYIVKQEKGSDVWTYSCNTDLTLLGAMLQFESAVGFKGNNAP